MVNLAIKYEPLPEQRKLFTKRKACSYIAMVTGVGGGKTISGAVRILIESQEQPGGLFLVGAPTYPMLRDTTRRTFFELFDRDADTIGQHPMVAKWNKTENHLVLRTPATRPGVHGTYSEIVFRSGDRPGRVRGLNLAGFWWDEIGELAGDAGDGDGGVWDISLGRLRQKRPRGGEFNYFGIGTGTPKGRNWVWHYWVQDPKRGYHLIQYSSRRNVHLPAGFIQDLEERYTDEFAEQEIEGHFVAFEGQVYRLFQRSRHIQTFQRLPEQFHWVIAGVDWGFANPGVIVVLGVDHDERIRVLHEERARRVPVVAVDRRGGHDDWVSRGKRLMERFNIQLFACDPSEPDNIASFRAAGLPARPANNSVMLGVGLVAGRLKNGADGRPRLIFHPQTAEAKDPVARRHRQPACLVEEIETLTYEPGTDRPKKENDHGPDALRYGVVAVDQPSSGTLTSEEY